MQIKLTSLGPLEKSGKLQKFPVAYERDGTQSKRTLVSIGKTKDVIETLKNAEVGSIYDIKLEKDGEYWNWVSATPVKEGNTNSSGKSVPSSEGRYETSEERANKQRYIVRQSSVSSAIQFLAAFNKDAGANVDDVIDTARVFEAYVFGELELSNTLMDNDDETEL